MTNQYTRPRKVEDTLWCNYHKQYEPIESFYYYPNKQQFSYYCKEGAKETSRKNHSLRISKNDIDYKRQKKESYVRQRHGITLQEYEERLAQQNYTCAICRVKLSTNDPRTHLDHDHTTGKLRSFLCTNCNRGLGHFQESISNLEKAINYLNTHNSNVDTIKEV